MINYVEVVCMFWIVDFVNIYEWCELVIGFVLEEFENWCDVIGVDVYGKFIKIDVEFYYSLFECICDVFV